MKTLSLTALAIFTASAVFAQTKSNNIFKVNPQQSKHFAGIQALLSTQKNALPALRPTDVQQRLVAQIFERGTDGADSVTYGYSTNKGSQYNYNHILEPGYSTVLMPDLAPAYGNIYNQPSIDVLADSFAAYYNAAAYYRSYGSYNSLNKLDSFYRFDLGAEFENEERSYISYNAYGSADTLKSAVNDGGSSFAPVYLRSIQYNDAHQVIDDKGYYRELETWMNMQQFAYHYNSVGLLDSLTSSGTDGYSEQSIFKYDASGRIICLKQYGLDEAGIYRHYLTDTFGYTSGVAYITSFEEQYFNEEAMPDGGVHITQYPGASGKPDSIVSQVLIGDTWVNASKGIFAYNDFGNPVSIKFTDIMSGEIATLRFQYETYDAGLSVETIGINKDFSIYPNPFSNSLIIQYHAKQPQQATVLVADIAGKNIYRQPLQLNETPAVIALPEIASGVYTVQVIDAEGKAYTQKLIKK